MSGNKAHVSELENKMREVLYETIRVLFPLYNDPTALIKPHVWRDRKYVGEANGKVSVWRGMSANLVSIDFRYRTIFLDIVENVLPWSQRIRLFGEPFTIATADMNQFVVAFVLDFPLDSITTLQTQGFVPRRLPTAVHACIVAGISDFLTQPSLSWAAQIAKLVILQRFLSIHRKPLDAAEVPFQNLLYSTGYIHGYIVKNGLELQTISPPRRAGEFGHDLHAIVKNPTILETDPFPIGIEVYTSAIGYHVSTIPQYVNSFGLKGIIVVSKDDPLPALMRVRDYFPVSLLSAERLTQIGIADSIGIHHLPLAQIVADFQGIKDKLEAIIPTVPISAV